MHSALTPVPGIFCCLLSEAMLLWQRCCHNGRRLDLSIKERAFPLWMRGWCHEHNFNRAVSVLHDHHRHYWTVRSGQKEMTAQAFPADGHSFWLITGEANRLSAASFLQVLYRRQHRIVNVFWKLFCKTALQAIWLSADLPATAA